jgi:hypothetical protein
MSKKYGVSTQLKIDEPLEAYKPAVIEVVISPEVVRKASE